MEEFLRVFQISITIVLAPTPMVLDEISNVYTISKNTLQLRFYYGPGKLLKHEMINKRKDILIPTIHQDLATSMLVGDWQKSEELLNSLFNYFIEHEVDRDVICNELYRLLTYLLTNLFNGGHIPPFEKDALKNIFQFDTMTALKHFIQQKIKSLFQYIREKEGDNYQQIVNQIILYIKNNLDKSLIVEDIASNVYLSPNYIRSIFKEKTGETILSYITKARIEKATELLQNKSLKIKDICISVGFESVSYFCSLFRKYKGMTPNEFRKKNL